MPLKKFRLEIYTFATAENLIVGRQTRASLNSDDFKILPVIKGQHVQHPPNSFRYDMSKFHCPMPVERQTCKFCSTRKEVVRTTFGCSVCKVHICLNKNRNCFREYHMK